MRGLPDEACGILGGRDGRITTVRCMRNVRPGPASYEMDPEEQFQVIKEFRRERQDLAAIFHSHPAGPAYPSGIDVERAYWPGTLFPNYPGAVYLIVSLRERNAPVVKGFTIREGSVQESRLVIE